MVGKTIFFSLVSILDLDHTAKNVKCDVLQTCADTIARFICYCSALPAGAIIGSVFGSVVLVLCLISAFCVTPYCICYVKLEHSCSQIK